MAIEIILALFVLIFISVGTYFFAERLHIPYTLLLVLVGTLLIPISHIPLFHFIQSFQLTPELLFFVFLPILIFESAYNMKFRDLTDNVRSISLLSIVSLLLSTFFIAFVLFFALQWIHFPVPFFVTLIFGALISATDPVAVLALFKQFGAPKRLSLIFEGESLFNDGTAIALFLIVIDIALKGFHGIESVAQGIFMFSTMVVGGIGFGLLMGFVFAKLIQKVHDNENIEITLTMLMAHLTFILSELLSRHLIIGGQHIYLSSVIATVMASMVIGNYGRCKISPRVEEYMEKFWGYFAFIANSLVFILMGLLFAGLPIHFSQFVWPIMVTVLVVMIGRALSIYPVIGFLNRTKKEEHIPLSWQHLLSWGSLRGALAVTMVLLIPNDLTLAGWEYSFSIKEFISALTIGCVYFTLLVKATSIGSMIKKMKLDQLTPLEMVEYHESRALVYAQTLEKLKDYRTKEFVDEEVYTKLNAEYSAEYETSLLVLRDDFRKNGYSLESALSMYALGTEKRFLLKLFMYREISEPVYKKVLNKIEMQMARVEREEHQIQDINEVFSPDWFERTVSFFRDFLIPMNDRKKTINEYHYYRAQKIIASKVLHRLHTLTEHYCGVFGDDIIVKKVIALYVQFEQDAHEKMLQSGEKMKEELRWENEKVGRRGFFKAEEHFLDEIVEREMLPQKIASMLYEEFRHKAYKKNSTQEDLITIS
ncbi:MAG: sodium:proton antiporter [Candidatus Moranbacteria bacterium]|nr:sodium:proton antiporter [Candidatus Moranbacteria bacterium]MDD3965027.1 sodium:proton antiporter [Candidatus Moranbacteria bacterium]